MDSSSESSLDFGDYTRRPLVINLGPASPMSMARQFLGSPVARVRTWASAFNIEKGPSPNRQRHSSPVGSHIPPPEFALPLSDYLRNRDQTSVLAAETSSSEDTDHSVYTGESRLDYSYDPLDSMEDAFELNIPETC